MIPDTGYPDDPDGISLLPGVPEALRSLRAAGWRLIVVSNQSGVARGKFDLERLDRIHDRLRRLLEREGASLDALYFCPHHPGGQVRMFSVPCDHRKPAAGMLLSAATRFGLRLDECWLVGDRESDVDAAHNAGCRAVLLGEGDTSAELRADGLLSAAVAIIQGSGESRP